MNRTTATAERLVVATTARREPADRAAFRTFEADRVRPAIERPREYRIAHVFRTLGRGLVAEYDPA